MVERQLQPGDERDARLIVSGPIIVSSFLPGEGPVASARYDVWPVRCEADFSYANGIVRVWWAPETLVLVEHDMEFSDELVAGLLSCPRPLCSYPYFIWAHDRGWHYAQARGANRRIVEGEEWADHSSIGFCKITEQARVSPMMTVGWKMVENVVHHALGGRVIEVDPHHISGDKPDPLMVLEIRPPTAGRWHIHWPAIAHHHDYRPSFERRGLSYEPPPGPAKDAP